MTWSHSLGFAHYKLALAGLSAKDYRELMIFFELEEKAREEARQIEQESGLKKMFGRIAAEEEREKEESA